MISFSEMGVREDIADVLAASGFHHPTPIQAQAIPAALDDARDLVALAPTGTGKTAAFGVPIIQLVTPGSKHVQALVLCPTRELCVQVAGDMAGFAGKGSPIRIAAIYGGASISEQIRTLRQGVHVIVATPGRLNDFIGRKRIDLSRIRMMVLDEADEMLQMGFQDELNAILEKTPETKTTFLFSATMPPGLARIAAGYLKDPLEITVGRRNAGAENIRHEYYLVHAKHRYATLKRLADCTPNMYAIIFCRTRLETKEVAENLMRDGYHADALHGDLSQSQRDWVMKRFRSRQLQLLVATDVAARGLDVEDLTHVIHYTLPDEDAAYTHRSGRTGRAGKAGISISIINMREKYKIRGIEKKIGKTFMQGQVPSGEDILKSQCVQYLGGIRDLAVDDEKLESLLPDLLEQLESIDREELIKRFIFRDLNRYISGYGDAPDLNATEKNSRKQKNTDNAISAPKKHRKGQTIPKNAPCDRFTRFLVNVGKRDGVNPGRLIGQINDITGRSDIRVGKIKIMERASMLEADSTYAREVQASFENLMINGRHVLVTLDGERREAKRERDRGDFGKKNRRFSSKRTRKGMSR
jgi:ATP-dependent RNA helicase DeaD